MLFIHKYKKDFQKYCDTFEVPQEIIDTIFSEGIKMNVKPADDLEKERTVKCLKRIIKALIARDIWDMSEYFAIVNEESDIVQKAIELLQ